MPKLNCKILQKYTTQRFDPAIWRKSYIQSEDGALNVDLAPSRIHVFEINAPNIENDSFDVSKFVNGVYTKVK